MQSPQDPRGPDRDIATALKLLERLRPAIEGRDRALQVQIAGELIALRSPLGGQWLQLARMCAGNGELRHGQQALDLFVEAQDGSSLARYQQATALFEWGLLDATDAVMRGLPADQPDPLANAFSRGALACYLGHREEARTLLESVVAARPESGTAWSTLAGLTNFASDARLMDRLLAAQLSMVKALPAERMALSYALGKAHADRGEHELAFAAFTRGSREAQALMRHDPAADRRSAEDAVQGYSAARIAALARLQRQPTDRTIFVAGPARSGTTLVQQILTAHSAVAGGAELSRLALLANELGGASYCALACFVERHGAEHAARLWHHWLDERFGPNGRVVDKSLDSSRYLGLAATLLPDAPIVWTTRDPLDRAWSCFSTLFNSGSLPWSYDLEAMAEHFRLEERLLAQWLQLLGDRILVVPYEGLVNEPEPWIRRILAHCGLSEEPQVFAPHENRGAVTTASVAQVRRPINRQGVGAAEPYRQFLEPFLRAYQAA